MNSLFSTFFTNNYWLYVFIYMNKFWLIDLILPIKTVTIVQTHEIDKRKDIC